MPFDPMIGGAIADTIINPVMQHLTNVKNRKFAREMYGRQRQDALSDWEMQNAYNSPAEQMKRFKAAGLNPHLIYGQSNEGAVVRGSSAGSGNASPLQSDIQGRLMGMYDMKRTQLQTDNLREINENLRVDRDLKKANIANIISRTDLTEVQKQNLMFELGLKTDLRDTTIEGKKAEVENIKMRTNSIHSEVARAWDLHPGRLKEQAIDILNKHKQNAKTGVEINHILALIDKVKADTRLSEFDRELIDRKVNPKDPWYIRKIGELLSLLFD